MHKRILIITLSFLILVFFILNTTGCVKKAKVDSEANNTLNEPKTLQTQPVLQNGAENSNTKELKPIDSMTIDESSKSTITSLEELEHRLIEESNRIEDKIKAIQDKKNQKTP